MIRRKHSTSLRRTSDFNAAGEDVNPNSYLTNLADCMLVMTVGLLVALVTHYGVDLQKPEDQTTGQEVIMDADGDGVIDDAYKKTGSVYYDESTGKYYMVQDDA